MKRTDIQALRGFSVLAVLLYHLQILRFKGGYLGVDIFFVISGFLITRLLLLEVMKTGHISISQFYLRRMRRLLPAAVFVFLVAESEAALAARELSPALHQAFDRGRHLS